MHNRKGVTKSHKRSGENRYLIAQTFAVKSLSGRGAPSTSRSMTGWGPSCSKGFPFGSHGLSIAQPYNVEGGELGCASRTQLGNSAVSPLSATKRTYNGEDSFFHLLMTKRASSDEIAFILTAERFGLEAATYLAAKFGWQCQRPLRALRAMVGERGRTYTDRGRKTRARLGSFRSLIKRPR